MARYKLTQDLILQKSENKTVIFDSKKSLMISLNKSASLILQKIKIGWQYERILEFIVNRYRVNENKAKKDINQLIEKLRKYKIITEY